MSKRYIISQGSLEMAHRSRDSELVGRIFSQQNKTRVSNQGAENSNSVASFRGEDTGQTPADTYNPNHPQIVRFYKKWGKQE